MAEIWAGVITGLAALIGVLLGAWLGFHSQRAQWLKDKQFAVCVQLGDELSVLYNGLALSRRGIIPDLNWQRWNQSLFAVSLLCKANVVEAAREIDRQLWLVDWPIRGGQASQADWIKLRKSLETARDNFAREARVQLNRRAMQYVSPFGRPEDSDPMWRQAPQPEQSDESSSPSQPNFLSRGQGPD